MFQRFTPGLLIFLILSCGPLDLKAKQPYSFSNFPPSDTCAKRRTPLSPRPQTCNRLGQFKNVLQLSNTVLELQVVVKQMTRAISQQAVEINMLAELTARLNATASLCNVTAPTMMFSMPSASADVSDGASASFATSSFRKPGQLIGFGENGNGQVGSGGSSFVYVPVAVSLSGDRRGVRSFDLSLREPSGDASKILLSAGSSHSVMFDGKMLHVWGKTYLGDGTNLNTYSHPTAVSTVNDHLANQIRLGRSNATIVSLCAGTMDTIFVSDTGETYGFGANFVGGLGVGDNIPHTQVMKLSDSTSPDTDIPIFQGQRIDEVLCGLYFTSFFAKQVGQVWATGNGVSGELGVGAGVVRSLVPVRTLFPQKQIYNDPIVDIQVGFSFSLARTASGKVYSWGFNAFGQLGDDSQQNKNLPKLINFPKSKSKSTPVIVMIACGGFHSHAMDSSGQVFAWGHDRNGQLCLSKESMLDNQLTPKAIDMTHFGTAGILKFNAGKYISMFVTKRGSLFGCGTQKYLGIGKETDDPQTIPIHIQSGALEGKFVKDVSVGFAHTLVWAE